MSAIYVRGVRRVVIMCCCGVLWCIKLKMIVLRVKGISWVMAGSVREELWAWNSIRSTCRFVDMILFTLYRRCGMKEIGGFFMWWMTWTVLM